MIFSQSPNKPEHLVPAGNPENFGPDIDTGLHKPSEQELSRLRSEKQKLITRMLNSAVFKKGEMSLADIANITGIPLKLVKKTYRDLQK